MKEGKKREEGKGKKRKREADYGGVKIVEREVQVDQIPVSAPGPVDVLDFVMEGWWEDAKTPGSSGSGSPHSHGGRIEMSFPDHVGCYMQLLRDFQRASVPKHDEYTARRLRQYVYLTCFPKMLERLRHGTGKRDWLAILMRPVGSISPSRCNARITRTVTKHEYTRRPPNQHQEAWLRGYSRYNPKALQLALESAVYDISGRKRFQVYLSALLSNLVESLLTLEYLVATATPSQRILDPSRLPRSVMGVEMAMRNLKSFLAAFEKLLAPHFRWLEHIWNPRQSNAVIDRLGNNPAADQQYPELLHVLNQEDTPEMMLEWLKLVCEHETSLSVITYPGRKESQRIQEACHILCADVHIVDFYYEQGGEGKTWFDCINEMPSASFDASRLLNIAGRRVPGPHNAIGTMHAAALLVALLACAKDAAVKVAVARGSLDNVLPTSLGTLRLFEKLELYVETSQLRCFSCCCVLGAAAGQSPLHVATRGKIEPDQSTRWQECLLPGFMPQQIALRCKRDFEAHASKRLKSIVKDDAKRESRRDSRAR